MASRSGRLPALVFTTLLLAGPGAAQPANLAMDTPTRIAGIESVCTGVGLDARDNPLWNSYALKVEIAGGGGRYLGDERVTLRQGGKELLSLICAGPWILFSTSRGPVRGRGRNSRSHGVLGGFCADWRTRPDHPALPGNGHTATSCDEL